ncbi:MAG TPA: ribonuclease E/G, partial [Stellaceae bacterium]|nr:ribonuclease E/G [Stellaceae bacterium]
GVIVRTAGSERSKAEIKRDFEYLMRLWEEIRDLTLRSTAPALIYEEGNLIKRSIRDLYARDIDEVIVDGEEGYRTAKSFMKMLMPSHAKRVKPYRDSSIPLFSRFQVEGPIDAIHSPIVQLRSGGYIVINPTEALVAIDVNSGRSTKERDIEETALKTNLEAAEEIARQLRLRDLAGLIVIDFIDMEEGRNQGAVERRLKESMRHDRARIQLGRISPFGLLELSRQRLRPSLLETSTAPCPHCNGTGHIRSTESTVLHVLRAIEEEGTRRRSAEVSVAVPTIIALYILNQKRDALQSAEHRYGFRVTITNDDSLIPPAYRLEQIRALTQEEIAALPVPIERAIDIDEDEDDRTEEDEETLSEGEGEALVESAELQPEPSREEPGRRRRRRRHRGGESLPEAESSAAEFAPPQEEPSSLEEQEGAAPDHAEASERGGPHEGEHKRRRRGRRGGRRRHRGHAPEGMTTTPHPEDETSAIEATPAGEGEILPTESVPVAESSDLAPRPETTTPPEPQAAPAPRLEPQIMEPLSPPPSRPTNPKRGWWQRITSSS